MDLSAKIMGIKYTPYLCAHLKTYAFKDLPKALSKSAVFILTIDEKNKVAVSWWVSPKRTRSYPYARIYDTLNFSGKKITVIPVMKDEGEDGDRDFLQWDTVSLMSLLGVYVIIGYYVDAKRSARYRHKITDQRFDANYVRQKINEILSYQSDALHWNLEQINNIGAYGQRALENYKKISKKTRVAMHSRKTAEKRIGQLQKGKEKFMKLSRRLAEAAQRRESVTIQPRERLTGRKGTITIQNYLGGFYYFTTDEIAVERKEIYLIEAKHGKKTLPSVEDIKDGLVKMILFTNLKDVKSDGQQLNAKPILKLTTDNHSNSKRVNAAQKQTLELLNQEAKTNNFRIKIF